MPFLSAEDFAVDNNRFAITTSIPDTKMKYYHILNWCSKLDPNSLTHKTTLNLVNARLRIDNQLAAMPVDSLYLQDQIQEQVQSIHVQIMNNLHVIRNTDIRKKKPTALIENINALLGQLDKISEAVNDLTFQLMNARVPAAKLQDSDNLIERLNFMASSLEKEASNSKEIELFSF